MFLHAWRPHGKLQVEKEEGHMFLFSFEDPANCDELWKGAPWAHWDAKGLRVKPFIHYDSLVKAFGRDQANGLGAEGPAEVDEDLNNEDDFVDLEEDGLPKNIVRTSVTRTPSSASNSTRTRKRPRDAYA
ncbi:hypothetical protein ACLB2K_004272 [Fragaria x ananassa]